MATTVEQRCQSPLQSIPARYCDVHVLAQCGASLETGKTGRFRCSVNISLLSAPPSLASRESPLQRCNNVLRSGNIRAMKYSMSPVLFWFCFGFELIIANSDVDHVMCRPTVGPVQEMPRAVFLPFTVHLIINCPAVAQKLPSLMMPWKIYRMLFLFINRNFQPKYAGQRCVTVSDV